MNGLIWDAETLATGAQLLLAATIGVHVLVVRPRAARENLALTAKIIGDDVTLDQNHGLLPVRDADVERVRQLLGRVVQDPATAKNVSLAADAELASTDSDAVSVDRIRIEAYLTRLAAACARYQHDAWPLNGATQLARHAFRPSAGPLAAPPVETEEPVVEAADETPGEATAGTVDEVIDLAATEPRRMDLDDREDPDATVERAAVSVPPENSADGERGIPTRLRAQIDLTRLKADHAVQVPAQWQPPSRLTGQ